MMGLFDSHAHYIDKKFDSCEGGAARLLDTLFEGEVSGIINVGTSAQTSHMAVAQAAAYPHMYAAVGLHPEDAQACGDIDGELVEIEQLLMCAKEKKIVALGEIGFDYYWEPVDKPLQSEVFERQMSLAEKYCLPVIIHDREAHGDCFDMICKFPSVRGVFHSYSGSPEMALELVRRGWYISFSGVLTFKNNRRAVDTAAAIPPERILIETDCPYLAPVPHRGKLNHSGLLSYTVERLSEIIGMTPEETARLTEANAAALFGISIV